MGSEYYAFLDILVFAVTAAFLYRGAKKGAVGVLVSSLAAVIAFAVAFFASGPVSDELYNKYVREQIQDYMNDKLGGTVNAELIRGLSDTDMSKALIKGVYLGDMEIVYDERNTAILDLSSVDLSETGIDKADLRLFGIGEDTDWSLVKVGNITVTASDVNKYGLGNVVLAHIITARLGVGGIAGTLADIGKKLGDTVSVSLKDIGSDLAEGSRDTVYRFVVSIMTAADKRLGDRVMDDIITPTVLSPLKLIVFMLIFAVVVLILNVIANVSKIINRVPIVSSVNGVLGAVLGLAEAAVVLSLMCMVIKLLISICGDSLVFVNTQTIDKTYIFKYLYAFDPLKLVGAGQ